MAAEGQVTIDHPDRARIDVRWTIENPSGKPIRFTTMTRTAWQSQNDSQGRSVGGQWVVSQSDLGFTLKPGTNHKKTFQWFPCNGRGHATGTYREVQEGTDAEGNPVRLVL
jgi:hypothetical protein